ncbi:MAG: hypothetical protein C4520_21905 [Candidatus Abyssobacteria bacterium SURF_5]|jgi:FtsZ-binding cell division protein ZapB|uniref:Uncharacterized protein n=1 Tax=Abyssobacteria bacterium (strain SURF_5) TaxID=2093360 RepID=A0A3A4N2J5_ABYX5|nr:MAG: hypothetical protein C4520_21905 [Candidatus Abyssubacteria bacterium SURF_5]
MDEKLARLEEQMKRLVSSFRDACEKNEHLRRQNERLLNELLEKTRQMEVLEERGELLLEAQAEKKKLEAQREQIRKEINALLERVRALKGEQHR